ncbi:Acyltransferase [Cnuella takakiae]|uniref:Acyltransferase n=1 Tax=Cnuella takakiae TaxID=1302690 RepID=A0A1M5ICW8_9BACT|nr:1-acyl-sn-glycerol-3-phosphate acyltransferase [Cnuella takakiae]SHG26085.1 Acyltransferase [Cnuella takakiae]
MFLFRLFAWWFRLKGWRTAEAIPASVKQCVVIAAPHTSNWDFVYSLACAHILGVRLRYLAKQELFRFPLGGIMRATGGIPVTRSRNTKLVDTIIQLFQNSDELRLMIPAEGTRKKVDRWKTGFYHVALGTGVPVYLAYLDYNQKIAGFGKAVYLTGDKEKDAAVIRDFYKDKVGKYPELFNLEAIRFE